MKLRLCFCLLTISFLVLTNIYCASEKRSEQESKKGEENHETWHAEKDIIYAQREERDLGLDIYWLKDDKKSHPLLVWIHGGAWLTGDKKWAPREMVNEGYVVASISYRFSQESIFPAQIMDCKAAIRWLRAHAEKYTIDPKRIGVWGASAGGHLVALLGTAGDVKELEDDRIFPNNSSRVQAVCDFFGPTDFLQMDAQAIPEAGMIHDAADSPESKLVGGPIQENPEKAAFANPITYVSQDDPPFLIVHGDQDPLVPVHQSEILYSALKTAGIDVKFHIVEGAGHGWNNRPEINQMVLEFFNKHLK